MVSRRDIPGYPFDGSLRELDRSGVVTVPQSRRERQAVQAAEVRCPERQAAQGREARQAALSCVQILVIIKLEVHTVHVLQ